MKRKLLSILFTALAIAAFVTISYHYTRSAYFDMPVPKKSTHLDTYHYRIEIVDERLVYVGETTSHVYSSGNTIYMLHKQDGTYVATQYNVYDIDRRGTMFMKDKINEIHILRRLLRGDCLIISTKNKAIVYYKSTPELSYFEENEKNYESVKPFHAFRRYTPTPPNNRNMYISSQPHQSLKYVSIMAQKRKTVSI